jgi:hypothetical protein
VTNARFANLPYLALDQHFPLHRQKRFGFFKRKGRNARTHARRQNNHAVYPVSIKSRLTSSCCLI